MQPSGPPMMLPLAVPTYGSLATSLIDDVETTESVLREISNQVHATRTAVLAQVTEQSPEVIDAAMERLGGEVTRRPVVEVEQEIAAAKEAQRKACVKHRRSADPFRGSPMRRRTASLCAPTRTDRSPRTCNVNCSASP